jgi:hypothetical protein
MRKIALEAKSPRLDAEIDLMDADHGVLARDFERAEELLISVLKRVKGMKSLLRTGEVFYRLARLELARSDRAKAREYSKSALALFESIGAKGWIEKTKKLL